MKQVIAATAAAILGLAPSAVFYAAQANASTVPSCVPGDIAAHIHSIGNAAGSEYFNLNFTNERKFTCKISGFPLAYFTNSQKKLITPGAHHEGPSKSVTLPPQGHAGVQYQVGDPYNYGTVCKPEKSAYMLIVAPGPGPEHGLNYRVQKIEVCTQIPPQKDGYPYHITSFSPGK